MKQEVDNASRGESSQAARAAQFSNFHQRDGGWNNCMKDRNSQLSQGRKTWGCEKIFGATNMFWANGIKSKVIKRNSDITFQPSLGRHYTSWKWWSHKQALHVVKQTCSWWIRRVLKIPTRKANFNQDNICSPFAFPSQLQIKEVGRFLDQYWLENLWQESLLLRNAVNDIVPFPCLTTWG